MQRAWILVERGEIGSNCSWTFRMPRLARLFGDIFWFVLHFREGQVTKTSEACASRYALQGCFQQQKSLAGQFPTKGAFCRFVIVQSWPLSLGERIVSERHRCTTTSAMGQCFPNCVDLRVI